MTAFIKGQKCTWSAIIAVPDATAFQCPHCGGPCVLSEFENEERKVSDFEAGRYAWTDYDKKNLEPPGWQPRPHPGYAAMLTWACEQPRCFKHVMHLFNAYKKYTGKTLDMAL